MSVTYIPLEVWSDRQVNLQHGAGDGLHVSAQLQAREVVNEPAKAQQEIRNMLMIRGFLLCLCHVLLWLSVGTVQVSIAQCNPIL